MTSPLKAPFPYFGGKSRIADRIWPAFGDARNYVEPFAGSLAVLLARPSGFTGPETVNDYSAALTNLWRALVAAPGDLAALCVGPVSEIDTEARHNTLVQAEPDLRTRLGDPGFFDVAMAAYHLRGLNEWIGTGWATGEGPWSWSRETGWSKRDAGTGINRQLPHLGDAGTGINRQLPHLGDAGTVEVRTAFLRGWFSALRDRLCQARICCGDFERVLSTSVTTKQGVTAVYLDPPYRDTDYVYGVGGVHQRVVEWCRTNASDPRLRIAVSGRGDEFDSLGWRNEVWTALRGYAGPDNDTRKTEAVWFSPHCVGSNNDCI